MGAPITVNTANPAPIAAKSAVMVRDVGRVSQLFTLLERRISAARPCAMKLPLHFWFLPGELPVISSSAMSWLSRASRGLPAFRRLRQRLKRDRAATQADDDRYRRSPLSLARCRRSRRERLPAT